MKRCEGKKCDDEWKFDLFGIFEDRRVVW